MAMALVNQEVYWQEKHWWLHLQCCIQLKGNISFGLKALVVSKFVTKDTTKNVEWRNLNVWWNYISNGV